MEALARSVFGRKSSTVTSIAIARRLAVTILVSKKGA
jgi:hypothetical protein